MRLIKFKYAVYFFCKIGIKNLKSPKAFIDYSQTIDDVYENLEDYEKKSVWWYDSRYGC